MRYYSKEGYIDFDRLLAADRNDFIFMDGVRGIGKTFGILKYMIDNGLKFIYPHFSLETLSEKKWR